MVSGFRVNNIENIIILNWIGFINTDNLVTSTGVIGYI